MHVLFEEGLVAADLGGIAEYVNGLDDVRDLADAFSPEDVSDYCGVSADDIRVLARELAAAPTAMLATGPGYERRLDMMLRLGPYGDAFGAKPDGLTLDRLKSAPHGIDLGPLQPRLPEVLRTPSGRIELAPQPLVADAARLRDSLGGNVNQLNDGSRLDPLSGTAVLNGIPVDIAPAD